MAKAGKIIALIAGLLTFIGTFGFSLITFTIAPDTFVNSGIGGVIGLINMFQTGVSGWTWQLWVFVIGYMVFLLSFILILIGIKSRIAAFIGSLLPLTVFVFVFLGYFGWWEAGWNLIITLFSSTPLVAQWVPMTFGFGLAMPDTLILGLIPVTDAIMDLGTFIVGAGGLLSLVSVFMTREDY